jgi:cardiolipin synthase
MVTTLPNLLTISRILVIPALVATFYVDGHWAQWTAVALFAAAGLTDWFDGHLARTQGLTSNLGRFLDPVADKLLVAAALMMLVATDGIGGWTVLPTVVILCREIAVSGLREFLAELRVIVRVSTLAKWKTAAQMVAIGFLLSRDAGQELVRAHDIGVLLLWIAAILTIYTGYDYLRSGLKYMADPEAATAEAASRKSSAPAGP